MRRALILACFILSSSSYAVGQTVHNSVSSVDHASLSHFDIIEDVDFLISRLEAVHPDLYRYSSKQEISSRLSQVKIEVQTATPFELWKKLQPIISSFNDGHTFISPPWNAVTKGMKASTRGLFPVFVKPHQLGLEVKSQYDVLQKGDIITSIEGITVPELTRILSHYVSGESASFRSQVIMQDFATYLWIRFGEKKQWNIEFQKGSKKVNTSVSGVSLKELLSNKPRNLSPILKRSLKSETVKSKRLSILTIPSFEIKDNLQEFITSSLSDVKQMNPDALIIDVRGNGGGNSSMGDTLMSSISSTPFRQYSRVDIKVSNPIKDFYGCNIIPRKTQCFNDLFNAIPGTIIRNDLPFTPISTSRYNGEVYVLTDHLTFSSATDFAVMVKDFNVGKIVGEPTGGVASSFGDIYPFVLKNSGLSVGVSHKYFLRPNGSDLDTVLQPDYLVRQKISQNGCDIQLKYTEHLIVEDTVPDEKELCQN